MAYLLIPDKKQSRKVPIKKSVFFIGRARENDLILHSDSLSRFHAQINRRGDDFVILDRGSLNGVFVNGSRLYGETVLKDGDIIGFGDVHVRFLYEEPKLLAEKERKLDKIEKFPVSSMVDSRSFAPEKRERYLELLYRFSAGLLQQFPSSDLGDVALGLTQDVWHPDRSCFMLRESEGDWHIASQRFGGNAPLTGESIEISRSLVRELERNEEALLVSHRTQDQRFSASDSLQRQNVNSAICAPLWNNRKIHGFLYADILSPDRSFAYADLEMFVILANLIAMKWENDQLWHQTLLQQQLEQELNLAADIQRKFFPAAPPAVSGYDVAAVTIPTRKVGGDAYFWHERTDGKLVLMIADVMGKGLPSALLMSQVQAIMKIFSERFSDAREIVTAVNDFIYKHSTQEKFISAVVLVISPEDGRINFCNAGHNPPFILRPNGSAQMLEDGGTPVGVFPDQEYMRGEASIGRGDIIVLYTDGLTEARNATDEEFGVDRLVEVARSGFSLPSSELTTTIIQAIRQWLGTDQEDDWTLMVVKRKSEG